jgi:hypothetical protein
VSPGRQLSLGAVLAAAVLLSPSQALAQAALNGQSGLINMPDGRIAPDGTWRLGLSYVDPYLSAWSSLSIFPYLEVSGRFTQIEGLSGFPGTQFEETYGDYKDKEADIKLRLLEERGYWPSLALGAQDFTGTGLFEAQYIAASKKFGGLDLTLGYGRKRIDGVFGGLRFTPAQFPRLSFLAEYDATDYAQDRGADLLGIADRDKSAVVGLEYRWKWLTGQVSYGHNELGINAYVSIPLQMEEFVPKVKEPEPYTLIVPRPTAAQWAGDPAHQKRMVRALLEQDFKGIRTQWNAGVMRVELTNVRITLVSRAVGRAARVILLTSPIETREIEITYTVADLPFVTYTFTDARKLQRYFNGMLSRQQLAETVTLSYAQPAGAAPAQDSTAMLDGFDEDYRVTVLNQDEGDLLSLRSEGAGLSKFKLSPHLGFFFNDPSGALRYDLYLLAAYRTEVLRRTFFEAAVRATLLEDVSEVDSLSNSQLPHVRSDVTLYAQQAKLVGLERLLLNRFVFPATRVYGRVSAGYYERMFGGAGGQVLYLPRSGKWAVDMALDWVKQRDFDGGFGFQDYSVWTGLVSVRARLPVLPGTTLTVRGGRFLAGDEGVRFELKRRFRSGFEFGLWYTRTNGDDITSPGSPSDPYYDKGVFVSIPLATMLPKDTQSVGFLSLAPWTRDVGQMVVSPADLYTMFELEALNVTDRDGLVRFGELDDDYPMPPHNAPR